MKAIRYRRSPEIDALVGENLNLAHYVARKAWGRGHRGVIFDDVESGVMHQLWACASRFEASRGIKFSTYAYKSMMFRARRVIEVGVARKRDKAIQLDPKLIMESHPSVVSEVIVDETRRANIAWVQNQLSRIGIPRNREILFEYLGEDNVTLEEIGQRLGLTRERVRQIVQKGSDMIRKARERETANES